MVRPVIVGVLVLACLALGAHDLAAGDWNTGLAGILIAFVNLLLLV